MEYYIQQCKGTGKFCYSSEASATRALNKYSNIKRTYKCDSCNKWHTTSMGMGLALKEGIVTRKPKKSKKGYPASKIQNRLDFLNKKINNDA